MKTNFCRVMATMALRYRNNIAIVNVERDVATRILNITA